MDISNQIKKRIDLINSFDSKYHPALVNTQIIEQGDHYSYKQELLTIKKIKSLKHCDFIQLVDALEYFKTLDFIHADLNKKNIIYTDDGFKIIDYEPSLLQIRNQIKQLMVTIPYTLKSDLDSMQATIATDKLGFFYFILRVNNVFPSIKVVNLAKHFNHTKHLGFDVNDITSITYQELLDRAYSKIKKG